MIFEKLEREEKEAEKLMFGENLEEKKEDTTLEEQEEKEQIKEPEKVEVVEEPVVIEDKEDWKKRFTNFKATTDTTIFKLRKENASLKSEIASLAEKNEVIISELVDLKKQIHKKKKEESYDDLFTQEDRDILGADAIDIFKKAVKKVSPQSDENEELKALKDEIKQLKQDRINQLKREQHTVEEESFNNLKARLSSIVEDWQDIDEDPAFMAYLDEIDDIEGTTRKELFSSAVQSRKVREVANFYKDFKSQRSPKKEDILSKKITPVGTTSTPVDTNKETKKSYTISEYNKFMDDLTRGKYKGKEKEAKLIEAKFDKAFFEGRIIE